MYWKLFFLCIITLISCNSHNKHFSDYYGSILNEKCMILNASGDNSFEGEYLRAKVKHGSNDVVISGLSDEIINLVADTSKWVMGWGNDKPYYDGGMENIRKIARFQDDCTVSFGSLLRGQGFPVNNQAVVLWNRNPSDFRKPQTEPLFNLQPGWPSFAGQSISFSKIVSVGNKYLMYFQEADTSQVNIYVAESKDLVSWFPANLGRPILTEENFKNADWTFAKYGDNKRCGILTDVIYAKNSYYLLMYGYNKVGKRNIGLACSSDPISGPWKVIDKPIIKSGKVNSWDQNGCFHGKILSGNNEYHIYYDGIDKNGVERLGHAVSGDLIKWTKNKLNPVIDNHFGWQSSKFSSEPALVQIEDSKVCVYLTGAKHYYNTLWSFVCRKRFMNKPGNVNDNQIGLFISDNPAGPFLPHRNNPVFINDYADAFENDHLGASLQFITHDGAIYMFYMAKTDMFGGVYKPYYRIKSVVND